MLLSAHSDDCNSTTRQACMLAVDVSCLTFGSDLSTDTGFLWREGKEQHRMAIQLSILRAQHERDHSSRLAPRHPTTRALTLIRSLPAKSTRFN